jgi:hypothetical protein
MSELLSIWNRFFNKRKHYTSIKKLPILIWWEVTEKSNLDGLAIRGHYSQTELYSIYTELLQEYYDNFGTTEEYEYFVKLRFEYAKSLANFIAIQDGMSKQFYLLAKSEIEDYNKKSIKKTENNESLTDILVQIEKQYGFQIDESKLSTYKFYTYLKGLKA